MPHARVRGSLTKTRLLFGRTHVVVHEKCFASSTNESRVTTLRAVSAEKTGTKLREIEFERRMRRIFGFTMMQMRRMLCACGSNLMTAGDERRNLHSLARAMNRANLSGVAYANLCADCGQKVHCTREHVAHSTIRQYTESLP